VGENSSRATHGTAEKRKMAPHLQACDVSVGSLLQVFIQIAQALAEQVSLARLSSTVSPSRVGALTLVRPSKRGVVGNPAALQVASSLQPSRCTQEEEECEVEGHFRYRRGEKHLPGL